FAPVNTWRTTRALNSGLKIRCFGMSGFPFPDCIRLIENCPVFGVHYTFVSVRQSAVVVGAFWILHGLYDLTHSQFITNAGVPGWYPVFCFSVDVVGGAYLLWLSRRISNANLRQA
ncbi:MAG TPA: hypothetical protein VNQ79_05455, partial [Blastocatellia bacterium]|nr:hypothetical protein [Blastocatellia bacterium]